MIGNHALLLVGNQLLVQLIGYLSRTFKIVAIIFFCLTRMGYFYFIPNNKSYDHNESFRRYHMVNDQRA